jgi:hypothetical protein
MALNRVFIRLQLPEKSRAGAIVHLTESKALMTALLALVLSSLLVGCSVNRELRKSLENQTHVADPDFQVRYMGTGCFIMNYKGSKLLTDPFISNPRALRSIAGTISTDSAYVTKHLRPDELSNVRLVASGHAHYDHLMDLPFLCSYMPEDARLCVNSTGKHILASYGFQQPVVILDSLSGDSMRIGEWVYAADSSIRILAITSMHPPQFMGIHLMRGHITQDLTERPTRMQDWLQGRTHAFIADFMEHGKPARRVYFSSSMAPAPFGLFPADLLQEKAVDAVFLGAAGDRDPKLYPKPILELTRPRQVYLIHWESFFRSKDRKAKAISLNALRKFKQETEGIVGADVPVTITYPLKEY